MGERVEDVLRRYFVEELRLPPLADDDLLVEKGYAASAQILELVDYVEERFAVTLRPIDLTPDKLSSIANIAAVVRKRMSP
jgi:acyl carrier protein